MGDYCIHFVDHGGNVFDALEVDSGTDDGAIADAHRLDVPSIGAGFDIWHDSCLVHRYRHRSHRKIAPYTVARSGLIAREDFPVGV
jgi:hypothetical protein